MTNNNYKLADFYAGIGGISLAFELTNKVETIYAVDKEKKCKDTYDLNHKTKLVVKDISELKSQDIPEEVDIFCLGFNCQPFSIAGKRLGFKDKRTDSLKKTFLIIKTKRPKCVFIENVKNLVTHNDGKSFKVLLNIMKKAGYPKIFYKVLNTSRYTVIPQNRERIFLVGFRQDIDIDKFNFPEPVNEDKVLNWRKFLENDIPEKYFYSGSKRISEKIIRKLEDNITNMDSIYQYRRGIVRQNKSKLCPTLVAQMGTGGHNVPLILTKDGKIRKLIPRECFNLQGFPKSFLLPGIADGHLYKQVGNSVTVPLVKKLAKEIVRILDLQN